MDKKEQLNHDIIIMIILKQLNMHSINKVV